VTRLEAALVRIDSDLRKLGCRWALVGGLAVSARARPRTTQDVDVAIAVSGDQQAEQLIATLRAWGYEVQTVLEQTTKGRLATVRLVPPRDVAQVPVGLEEESGVPLVDLLFASSGIEPEVVVSAKAVTILPGLRPPVATTGHLLALKVLAEQANRPQDLSDAIALIEVASLGDLLVAKEAIELIARRGYDRGKDLRAVLARVISLRPESG
jgi:predicted nucleotidyltransferase